MTKEEPTDLDWIQLRHDMESIDRSETTREKFLRKFYQNPLVPIGCLVTIGALGYGLWCFKQGKSKRSQQMMRLRIAGQAFTIVALITGVIMTAGKR